jgi:hypothetical protein
MEREQILKVMVPVGALGLLLVIVGVVIALNSGGAGSTDAKGSHDGGTPAGQSSDRGGEGKSAVSAVPKFDFPLDGPEWKEVDGQPGLKYWDLKVGEGKLCMPGTRVKAQYTGWRPDGFSFDNPQKHGPNGIEFSLNGVVPGWTHGIPGMKVGGVRRLFIPSHLGYGPRAMGSDIPPNTDLIFEVELQNTF